MERDGELPREGGRQEAQHNLHLLYRRNREFKGTVGKNINRPNIIS